MTDTFRRSRPWLPMALLSITLLVVLMQLGLQVSNAIAGRSAVDKLMPAPDPESDSVSAIAAEFRVDESGAATYSIPLYATPGTAGVMPQLSLNYSSQGGYGPLGKGWSLGGISSITRCRATREAGDAIQNGVPTDVGAAPVNFSATDRFCLDGQRLLPSPAIAACAAVAGMTVQTLGTEIESFQRVCAYVPNGAPPTWAKFFTVERKDGSTSWYGDRDQAASANRPDGFVNAAGTAADGPAISWAQTRTQDSTGNYIDFVYWNGFHADGSREHLLSEVRYTGKLMLAGQAGPARPPYASIQFGYEARAQTDWTLGYQAGGKYTQRHRLLDITSNTDEQTARYYRLAYDVSTSGSRLDTLRTLTECHDATMTTCSAPTQFTWSMAKYEFAQRVSPPNAVMNLAGFQTFKMADVNGDGRQDIVYTRTGVSGCSSTSLGVALASMMAGTNTPTFILSQETCLPGPVAARGEGGWHLFDYNGDGRDDLFVSGPVGQGWRLHPSNGSSFDLNTNLISHLFIPNQTNAKDQPQLADFNGDGVMDILYPVSGSLRARVTERQGTLVGWGGERSVNIDASSVPPLWGCEDGWNPDVRFCTTMISALPTTKAGFAQLADFNGDSVSDLLFVVERSVERRLGYRPGCEVDPLSRRTMSTSDASLPYGRVSEASKAATDPCWERQTSSGLYAFVTTDVNATSIGASSIGALADGDPTSIVFGDANGDGLTDVFHQGSPTAYWGYAINTGGAFPNQGWLQLPGDNRHLARFADVNGDGRTDLLELTTVGGNRTYQVRYAKADGTYPAASEPLPGAQARLCNGLCTANEYAPIFGDIDGDGVMDFTAMRLVTSSSLTVTRATQTHVPRDVITRITNGFGAETDLRYAAMTNKEVYRRQSGSRSLDWGRGAAVSDFLAPMYLVASASSSAPRWNEPGAKSTVHYRYHDGRVQAGGRGFLGFGRIDTIDPNQTRGYDEFPEAYVVSSTRYQQDFPYIGLPLETAKRVVTGSLYTAPVCLTAAISNDCFTTPGQLHTALGGSAFSTNVQAWKADIDPGAAEVDFARGTQAPVHVRTSGTEEQLRDPFTGADTSLSTTLFLHGAYGNATQTVVSSYTGNSALVSRVTTANAYASDDAAKWRLGRLTQTTVTHQRPGKTDNVRTSSFGYAMGGGATGLLDQERVMPGGGIDKDVRNVYQLDAFGNRTSTTTCSSDVLNCVPSLLPFRSADARTVHRSKRTIYDDRGRYPVATIEPFWNGTGASEIATEQVLSRNLFGDITHAKDANDVDVVATTGRLGRTYFSWVETVQGSTLGDTNGGVAARITYRWCSQVSCPTGAVFRQKTQTTGAPTQWAYLDVLGRTVLQAAETFNIGVADQDVTAVCTAYDPVGRPARVSNPFFLPGIAGSDGPSIPQGVCATGRDWTTSRFDVLGRPTGTFAPDGAKVQLYYQNNLTGTYDDKGLVSNVERNGAGEVVQTTDNNGLALINQYDAAGNVQRIVRDAGRGEIANQFGYDVLGRKVAQDDQDSGVSTYEYNALGELLAQVNADSQRVESEYDARGRVWRRTVRLADASIETQSTFDFDTSPNGLGKATSEQMSGTYATWRGASHLAHQFARTYSYDSMGRPASVTTTIDGVTYPSAVAYDALGRASRQQDASTQWSKTEYDARGFARAVCFSSATDVSTDCSSAWQRTLATDARGNVLSEVRSASGQMTVNRTFNALNGRVERICADKPGGAECELVDEKYLWDAVGNLHTRQKEGRYLEGFTYDSLNRLQNSQFLKIAGTDYTWQTAPHDHWGDYDTLGNICGGNGKHYLYEGRAGCGTGGANSSLGGGTGNAYGAHRVSGTTDGTQYYYDSRGNQIFRDAVGTSNDRTIRYSADDKPYALLKGSVSAPSITTRFWYGTDGQRFKREDVGGKRTLYLGNVEIVTQAGLTTTKRMIGGFLLQTVINGTNNNRFLFHDQLGSLVKITDALGATVHSLDFKPTGSRRNTTNPQGATPGAPALTDRGFTGHEHLDDMDLIHMNGRIYDTLLARFVQPDPLIQAPGDAQSWNAYTYVFNNPLLYTDPTGHFSWKKIWRPLVAIVISVVTYGAATGWATTWLAGTALAGNAIAIGAIAGGIAGFAGGAVATGSLKGALQGAYSGLIFGGISGYFGGGLSTGSVVVSGVAGGVIAELQGGKFGHGFASAGLGALAAPGLAKVANDVARAALAAIVGGTISKITGGNFANGATTAAMMMLMISAAKYYTEKVGGNPTLKGGTADPSGRKSYIFDPGTKRQQESDWGLNAFGLNREMDGNWLKNAFTQGGAFSNIMTRIPGMNSLARLHDFWLRPTCMGGLTFNPFTNVGTMLPAAIVNYAAIMGRVLQPLSYQQILSISVSTSRQNGGRRDYAFLGAGLGG